MLLLLDNNYLIVIRYFKRCIFRIKVLRIKYTRTFDSYLINPTYSPPENCNFFQVNFLLWISSIQWNILLKNPLPLLNWMRLNILGKLRGKRGNHVTIDISWKSFLNMASLANQRKTPLVTIKTLPKLQVKSNSSWFSSELNFFPTRTESCFFNRTVDWCRI